MIIRSFFIVFFFALLSIMPVSAIDNSYTGQFLLDEIVIEDSRPEIESSGRLRVIPAKDLEERGVRTLDKALEMVPGINVRVGSDGTPRIDMRGFRSRHITLLLDGVPLNSTFDGQMDPRLIPVEIIEKIKISYGTGSVVYGSGSLGGVINIITKRIKKGTDKYFLQLETGSRVRQSGILRASGSEGDFDYFVGLSNELRNGYELSSKFSKTKLEDGDQRENSDLRRSSLLIKVGLTPSERWKWGMTIGHQKAVFGLPQLTKSDIFTNNTKYERNDNVDGRTFQLSTAYDAPGPWEFKLWYFYNRQESETNLYDDATYSAITALDSSHEDTKAFVRGESFQAIRTMGDRSAITISLKSDRSDWNASGYEISKKGPVFSNTNKTVRTQSIAAEYTSLTCSNVNVSVGGSINKQKKDGASNKTHNEFNLGLSKEVSRKTVVHVGAARKIRFPAIKQLYDLKSGDTNLDVERSMNYEIGMTHSFDSRTSGGLTIFQSTVQDYIEKSDVSKKFENFKEYRFRGVELTAQHKLKIPLVLKSSLSLMDSKEKDSTLGRDELQFRPKVKFTFAGTYNANNGFQAHVEFLHIDGQCFYARKTPFEKRSLNEINITNMRVSKPIRYNSFSVYAGIDNIFDRNYETGYGVPAPGRFWYLGLQTKL